jgi:hypothetical protein
MTRYIRNTPDSGERWKAAAIAAGAAAGVGLVSYYLARLLLAREPIRALPPEGPEEESGEVPPGGA